MSGEAGRFYCEARAAGTVDIGELLLAIVRPRAGVRVGVGVGVRVGARVRVRVGFRVGVRVGVRVRL